jgi:pilus assembly protein Flp/PilA
MNMKRMLKRLWKEEEGQDLMEYGLLLVLIVLVAAAAIGPLGTAIGGLFTSAQGCAATPTSCT